MTRRWWALLAISAVLLAGCTGIPRSSAPQVVRSVDRADPASAQSNIAPAPGDDPRNIVLGFLLASAKSPGAGHSAARQFLTSSAARKWQDDTTIVVNSELVGPQSQGRAGPGRGPADPNSVTVGVTGRRVAQLDSTGVYTPVLTATGYGDAETFSFKLTRAANQWRIDQLAPGVLIDSTNFASYQQRKLYFFDSAERALVPDLRYSPLTGQPLETWLLAQLQAGPRPELASSVVNEVPEQAGKSSVLASDPIVVELPGASQLDDGSRDNLAAQLAYTLGPSQYNRPLRLTDSGRTVQVPAASGATFSLIDFRPLDPDLSNQAYQPFFIRDGALINGDTNTPVAGYLGQSARGFSSIALSHVRSASQLVAAVSDGVLMVGTNTALSKVNLPAGQLSRPEWRPNSNEVWIGDGAKGTIYRISQNRAPVAVSITSPLGGGLPGQVLALRFSPDGVRLAAVVRNPNGVPSVWVGTVMSSPTDIRITAFEPVTAAQYSVTDVAWSDAANLLMIAADLTGEVKVWSMSSDGYKMDSQTTVGLIGAPTSIAAVAGHAPLVSASDSVWILRSSASWTGYPNGAANSLPNPGVNPIFALD